jgi:DNA-3-methyladenine glycosylase II
VKSRRLQPDDYARADRLLSRRDPVLRALIRTYGPCALATRHREDSFATAAESIVSQQLSAKAAATIYARVVALMPGGLMTPANLVAASDEQLRAAGLSRAKLSYLRDLSARVLDGRLHLQKFGDMDDDAVIAELTAVKGIGRWTADMFLIFKLQRPDVLPVGDVGIVNAMKRAYGLRKPPTPARMLTIAEPWRPYRSIACWYLWCSLENV